MPAQEAHIHGPGPRPGVEWKLSDIGRLADVIDQFLIGWRERIEYVVTFQTHTTQCKEYALTLGMQQLRHYECQCLAHKEQRVEKRLQLPLITQLVEAGYTVPVTGDNNSGSASNKP